MSALDGHSEERLAQVHPDLVRVVHHCAENYLPPLWRLVVTEGLRAIERQRELVRAGASQTMRSRHLANKDGLACAVDLAVNLGGDVRWDWPLYEQLGHMMKCAAKDLGVPIEWGGDWTTLRDGPHFQLPWKEYPDG